MESVIVRASKTVEAGENRIIYDYECTLPIGDLTSTCLSPNILVYLTKFMQNLIGDEEEDK